MKHLLRILAVAAVSICLPGQLQAQEVAEKAEQAVQTWFGTLDVQLARLRLVVDVTQNDDGSKTAVLTSLDQGNSKLPVNEFTDADGHLNFSIDKIDASFAGEISADGNTVSGKFTQAGVTRDLSLKRVDEVPKQIVKEAWVGDLEIGEGRSLRVQFRELEAEGETIIAFDSLTQRVQGMAASKLVDDDLVTFKVPAARAKFEGTFNEDKTQLDGEWSQMGNTMKLRLVKIDKAETAKERKRPQTPKPPFPYEAEDVEFENKQHNIKLGGTLTYPAEGGPFPCVVMVSGSGPQNRDETLMGHKPFAVLADYFARHGIATLRHDDRGVGDSTGSFTKATTADFAIDAEAAVDFVRDNPNVDPKRVGIVGHSEGGLIATIVAARRDDLAHVVLMAGPGVPGDQIIIDQTVAISKTLKFGEKLLKEQEAMIRELAEKAKAGLTSEEIDNIVAKYPATLGNQFSDDDQSVSLAAVQLQQFSTPWFKYFLNYDPRPDLEKAQCPTLALVGENDLQVTAPLNVPALKQALKTAGHASSKCVELPGLNHLFQPSETGSPVEYDVIEQTMDPSVPELIAGWIAEH